MARKPKNTSRTTKKDVQSTYDGSILRFAGGILIAIAVFAGVLAVMGVRFAGANLGPQPASSAEVSRQHLAEVATQAKNSATQLANAHPENTSYQTVANEAAAIATTLGEVWIAWPSGAPTGYTNAPVQTEAPEGVTGAQVVQQLNVLSKDSLLAADQAPKNERMTYTSVALKSTFLAIDLAQAEGLESPGCFAGDAVGAARVNPSETTLKAADSVRQWLETDAANIDPDHRDFEISRINSLTVFEDSLISAGVADKRDAFSAYPPRGEGETYTGIALSTLSKQLLITSADADKAGRETLLGFTCSLYGNASERAGFALVPAN